MNVWTFMIIYYCTCRKMSQWSGWSPECFLFLALHRLVNEMLNVWDVFSFQRGSRWLLCLWYCWPALWLWILHWFSPENKNKNQIGNTAEVGYWHMHTHMYACAHTHVHTRARASNIGCRLLLLLLICFKVLLKIQRFSSGSLDYNECFFELLFTVMLVIGHVYKITSFSTLRERFQFWFI